MKTLTLKISDNVYEKFSWLLNHFNSNEIEVLDNSSYISDDEYLKSIQGMEQSIINAANEPLDNFVTADKLDW